jgi:Mg2+ and Co2+ transporter CorA
MSTTSETELRAEISWLEARNREVNRQRIEAETLARSQAARLSELERENARMREALKPFADAADGLSERDYDARVVAWIGDAEPNNGGAYGLHASDFRRAAALAGSGEK